jgi:mono/diheme cytochrome c family protein
MRRRYRLAVVAAIIILPLAALAAGNTERAAILADYAARARAADPGFAGFSVQRGEALFRGSFTGGDARTPSCMSCHTADPRRPGRNAKTGRPIDPVAVSVDPRRYTDAAQVDKHFTRDCKSVLGRDCTMQERGDYITFMMVQ